MCSFFLEIMIQIDSLTAMKRYMDEQEPGNNCYDRQKDSRGECSGTRAKLRKFAKLNPQHPAVHNYIETKSWAIKDEPQLSAMVNLVEAKQLSTDPNDEQTEQSVPLAQATDFQASEVAESTIGGDTTCIVCCEGAKTHACAPCGHQCVCAACSEKIKECPVCRAGVLMWMHVRVA